MAPECDTLRTKYLWWSCQKYITVQKVSYKSKLMDTVQSNCPVLLTSVGKDRGRWRDCERADCSLVTGGKVALRGNLGRKRDS